MGQDFLYWDIDENGFITDCQPFQGWLWVGKQVINPQELRPGGYVTIDNTTLDIYGNKFGLMTLKHQIESVE